MWPQSWQRWVLRTKATSPFHRDTSWITYSFETGDMLGRDTQITTSLGKRLPSALHYFNYLKQDFTNKKHYFLAPHFSIFHPSQYIPGTTNHMPNMPSDFSSNSIWPRVSELLFDNTGRYYSVWSIKGIWTVHSPYSKGRFSHAAIF